MMDDDDIDYGIRMLLQENRDLKFKLSSLESENAALKAELKNARELVGMTPAARWIPVSSGELPKEDEEVLIVTNPQRIFLVSFHTADSGYGVDTFVVDGDIMSPVFRCEDVTHWMHLPEAPKEDAS